MNLCT